MSLLDDVSLMITPNGIAENVLFGALPQPIIGTAVTINPTFDTSIPIDTAGSGWRDTVGGSSTVAYSNGGIKLTRDGGECKLRVRNAANTNSGMTEGLTYKLVYDVIENNGALLRYYQGSSTTNIATTIGTHIYYFTQGLASTTFQLENTNDGTNITLDNVYIYPYTSADMDFTRETTATFVNYAELITSSASGFPRLDTPSGGGCPHILVEPQRTNICLRSEEMDNATWSKSNGSTGSAPVVTANNVVSPDGTQNAEKVVFDLNGGGSGDESIWSLLTQNYTSVSGNTYMISCYLKGASGGEQIILDVDSQNGNVVTLTTDWVRYSFSRASTTSGTRSIRFGSRGNNSGGTYGSDNPTVYMWGCQLEVGTYATSYIPTTSASVTRNKDVFTRTGIGDLIGTAGVLYLESASIGSGVQESITLSAGTTGNRIIFYYTASGNMAFQLKVGGSAVASGSVTGMTATDFHKVAVRYQDDSFQLFIDGVKKKDVSGTFTIPAFNRLAFDNGASSTSADFEGKIRNIQIYKTALTEAKCISLTS